MSTTAIGVAWEVGPQGFRDVTVTQQGAAPPLHLNPLGTHPLACRHAST